MSSTLTVGTVAELVRSKNAGPFWQTIDVFFSTDDEYRTVAENPSFDSQAIARLYRVAAADVHIYRVPDIRALKISFPRHAVQGSWADRDMHAGQQHIPLAELVLNRPTAS